MCDKGETCQCFILFQQPHLCIDKQVLPMFLFDVRCVSSAVSGQLHNQKSLSFLWSRKTSGRNQGPQNPSRSRMRSMALKHKLSENSLKVGTPTRPFSFRAATFSLLAALVFSCYDKLWFSDLEEMQTSTAVSVLQTQSLAAQLSGNMSGCYWNTKQFGSTGS